MKNIKHQINAESSISQAMLWWIIILLTESELLLAIAIIMIVGNIYISLASLRKIRKIDKNYFK